MRRPTTRLVPTAGLIVLITVLVYVPALRGGFIWDDDFYVTKNEALTSLEGLGRIWFELGATPQYYPLVHTSFWIEYHLWGLAPFGYHLVNVLLHAASAVLVWRILHRLGLPGAWWAGAIFAIHPVHVESVAWITERKNVLSGVFYLAAVWTYLRFCSLEEAAPAVGGRRRFYLWTAALFVCALLSKTVTCTLPAALLLIVWWKRRRIGARDLLPLLPLLVIGLVFGLVTVWMEKYHVGARGEDWGLSLLERCLLAGRILWFYVGKLLWPNELAFVYPRWEINAGLWWQFLYPLAAIAAAVGLWSARRRVSSGPLVAVLFFAGTLVPALGFFDVFPMRYSYVADHFQYLASIGVIALSVAVATVVFQRLPALGRAAGPLTGAAVLVVLGVLAGSRGQAFTSPEALWRDTIATNPEAWMAHNNLGRILAARGSLGEAIRHYHRALRIRPDDTATRANLALALLSAGAADRAIRQYRRIVTDNPDDPRAHTSLGVALLGRGRTQAAIARFFKALELDPNYVPARSNLGAALLQQGKVDEAVGQLTDALRVEPTNVEAHCNLAVALDAQGKLDEAVDHYRQALRHQPGEPRILCPLGNLLRRQGKLDEAIEQYRTVLRADPQHARATKGLQAVLAERQRQ